MLPKSSFVILIAVIFALLSCSKGSGKPGGTDEEQVTVFVNVTQGASYYTVALSANGLEQKWIANTSRTTICSMDYDSNDLVINSPHDIISLNPITGVRNWGSIYGSGEYSPWPRVTSSPYIDDTLAFAVSEVDPTLYCVNMRTGSIMWSKQVDASFANAHCSPIVIEDNVYAAGLSTLFCFNKFTGSVKWRYENNVQLGGIAQFICTNKKSIYISGNSGYESSINAETGNIEWGVSISNLVGSSFHPKGKTIEKNGKIFIPGIINGTGVIIALNEINGAFEWKSDISYYDGFSTIYPVFSNDAIILGNSSGLEKVNSANGSIEKLSYYLIDPSDSISAAFMEAPVVYNNKIFVASNFYYKKNAVIPLNTQIVWVIDVNTFEVLEKKDFGNSGLISTAPLVLAGNKAYYSSLSGKY